MVWKREALPCPPLKSSGGQAPHTPHLKAGHQRGLPPRRRPPSARSSCPAVDWFRHGFLGALLLPLLRTLLCCSGGTGLHGGRGGGGGMFGGVLVVGTAAIEAVGVWTRFLQYQLPLCKVCMLSLVPEL